MKVIDNKKVKTDLNLYHKLIKLYFKNETVKKFNNRVKQSIQANDARIKIYGFTPSYTGYEGLKKRAAKEGIQEAIELIKTQYRVVKPYYGDHCDHYWERIKDGEEC